MKKLVTNKILINSHKILNSKFADPAEEVDPGIALSDFVL